MYYLILHLDGYFGNSHKVVTIKGSGFHLPGLEVGRRLHHVGRGRHLRARANPLRGQRGARQEGNRGRPSQSSPGIKLREK
jgi:hypothetical protein